MTLDKCYNKANQADAIAFGCLHSSAKSRRLFAEPLYLFFKLLLMKVIKLFIFGFFITQSLPLLAQTDSAQTLQSLNKELERLQTTTVLLVPSQEIDYYPTWSPNGNKLGANVMGTWYEVDLEKLALVEATSRDDQKLGVINSNSSFTESTQAETWFDSTRFDPRKIESSNGTLIELAQDGFGVKFRITYPSEEPNELWQSGMENCHSLVLSPNENKVAFICEMNGIFVYKLNN